MAASEDELATGEVATSEDALALVCGVANLDVPDHCTECPGAGRPVDRLRHLRAVHHSFDLYDEPLNNGPLVVRQSSVGSE